MALPNGAGGYQVGDGNLTEVILGTQPAPTAKVAAATLTAAELATGIITYTGAAVALTMPLGTDLDAAFSSMKVNSSFYFYIINTGATNAATVTANTGVTLVGTAAVAAATSAKWLVRKTADATFVAYRVAG
jgi:hypothetical protein